MNISRYEETSTSLFICINSLTKPVYLEHFFTEEEKATELTRKETIEKLAGHLKVMEDEYVAPEQAVSKVAEAQAFTLIAKNITDAKAEFIADREAKEEVLPTEKEVIPIEKEVLPVEKFIK